MFLIHIPTITNKYQFFIKIDYPHASLLNKKTYIYISDIAPGLKQ